jgi:hypothetical protein
LYTKGDTPPPKPGERGIFSLSGLPDGYRQAWTIVPGVPFVARVESHFLPLDPDGLVRVDNDVVNETWPYEDYVEAIQSVSTRFSMESLTSGAELICLATLERNPLASSAELVRFPMRIERVLRGQVPTGQLFLKLDASGDLTQSEWDMRAIMKAVMYKKIMRMTSQRMLLFGSVNGEADVNPGPLGLLEIDLDDAVRLPEPLIANGKIVARWSQLSEMEDLLR